MAVLKKPAMTVELRTGEYGTPAPVVVVDIDERAHWRLCEAFMFRLASAVSMLSISESWIVEVGRINPMGAGRPQRAILKLELGDGTMEEAKRGVMALRQAVIAVRLDPFVIAQFQGKGGL